MFRGQIAFFSCRANGILQVNNPKPIHMKQCLLSLILFLVIPVAHADTYYPATIVFADGKSKTGLVESTFGDHVFFKASEKANVEKIESAGLSKLIFTIKGEKREYHYVKTYLGWGQKRISGSPMWLKVLINGKATLYLNSTTLSTPSNSQNSAGFLDYYCIRKGEPAAKWISAVSTMNNNQHFRAKAPLYFEDYPELAEKIKAKEYTWKDIETVVQVYNKWAEKKK